jgi:CubicO group peptidase (beta-lactamase class C family)
MYGIGSVSKVFTAVAIMQLVEEGKVKLDTPVVKYLPDFKMADKRYKDITVRMLLNHSSGLMGSTFSSTMLFDDNDTLCMDSLLQNLKGQRLKADPGAFSVYCNDGFSLAQLVVEKVSGQDFNEYVKNNITEPLNMMNTQTPRDEFDREKLAKTYLTGSTVTLPVENVNAIGAGGIYSSAEDMCRFAEIFRYETEDKVLSDTSSRAMAKSEYKSGQWHPEANALFSYGLGWDSVDTYPFNQYGIKAVVKGGDTALYHAGLIVLPEEGISMAVLSSGGASSYDQVFAQEILLKVLLAKGRISEIKPNQSFTAPVKTAMPASEKKNAGSYAFYGGVVAAEISDDGVLSLNTGVGPKQQFVYTGEGRFCSMDGSTYVSFEDQNGNTYLYVQGYSTLPYLGQIADANYQAQKIEANPLTKKVKAAWNSRKDKEYLLLNEKYSSISYAAGAPVTKISLSEEPAGYLACAKITDENHAKTMLQIPGLFGRDLFDITFYTKAKTEYLNSAGAVYVSEDAVKQIPAKSFTAMIAKDGYAQWFKLGSKSGGKKLRISLSKSSSLTIYDQDWKCIYSSLTTKETTVTLPKGGYVVFAGNTGAKLSAKY